jgi:hypothetical protein
MTERPERVGAARLIFLYVLVAGVLGVHLFAFIHLREGIRRGYPDFTAYYTGGTMVRNRWADQLYDLHDQYAIQMKFAGTIPSRHGPLPYIHPPFEALIFWPLAYLSYPGAFAVWGLLNVGILFAVAGLLRTSVSVFRVVRPWEFVLASLAFFPIFICLLQGQDSILLLLAEALAFRALKKNAEVEAGCWLGMGMFRFHFVIPVVILIVIWKGKRVALGFAAVFALLLLISAGMMGRGLLDYPAFALRITNTPGMGGVPAEAAPNLRGLVLGWGLPVSPPLGATVTLGASALLLLYAATRGRGKGWTEQLELQFSLAIAVAGLVAWQTNLHDLSLLVLPVVLLSDYRLRRMKATGGRPLRLGLLPLLPVLVGSLPVVLWMLQVSVNLLAIPLLWWVWEIGRELSKSWQFRGSETQVPV